MVIYCVCWGSNRVDQSAGQTLDGGSRNVKAEKPGARDLKPATVFLIMF